MSGPVLDAATRRPIESAAALAGAALVSVALAAVWPGTAILFGGLVAIVWISAYNPRTALLLALGLFCFEGGLKIGLTASGTPVDGDARGIVAFALDLGVAIAVIAVLLEDRWTTPRAIWSASSRPERAVIAAFGTWLVVSVIDIFVGGLGAGLNGFRLSQGYVVLALAGAVLGREPVPLVRSLLWIAAIVCGYAVARLITGPLEVEHAFVSAHDPAAIFNGTLRPIGPFQSAVALASFAAPALVFATVVAIEDRANRRLALAVALLAGAAVLASYVRVALVAIVLAIALALVLGALRRGRSGWRMVLVAIGVGTVVIGLGGLASRGVPYAEQRFEDLFDPGGDKSLEIRFDAWERSIDRFSESPLGEGLGQVGRASDPGDRDSTTDNSSLKVLVEQGVPGFIPYAIGLIGICSICAVRFRRGPPGGAGVAALSGFVCFILLGMAGEYVEQPGKVLAWLLLGVALAQAYSLTSERVAPGAVPEGPPMSSARRLRALSVAAVLALGLVAAIVTVTRESDYPSSVQAFPSDGDDPTRVTIDSWRELAQSAAVTEAVLAQLPAETSGQRVREARLEVLEPRPFSFEIDVGETTPARATALASEVGENLSAISASDDGPTLDLAPPAPAPISSTADEVVDALPGPFPPRPSPAWVLLVAIVAAAAVRLLWARAVGHQRVSGRSVLGALTTKARVRLGPGAIGCAAACAAAASLLLALTAGLTFFHDEWDVILNRPGWSAESLLRPHNEHIYLGPVLIYKVLLPTFGMESATPYEIVNILLLVTLASLVFVYVRRRLGAGAGLIAASVLLFLGPAQEDLLWPGGISFMGAMAAGVGALVALDGRGRRGDLAACGLLIVSLSFSTLGLMFALGAAVELLLRDRRVLSLYPAAVPALLYGLWYLAYGHRAESAASLDNLLGAPRYMADSLAAALASLFGLTGDDSLNWGRPLAVAATIGAVVLAARDRAAASTRFWAVAAIAGGFWISAAVNAIPGRDPTEPRYQIIGAVLVILAAAELLRGHVLLRRGMVIASVVAVAAVSSNLLVLKGGEEFFRSQTEATTAELSALQLVRDAVDPEFNIAQVPGVAFADTIVAGAYFEAIDKWGSPVDPPADLDAASEANRELADAVFATALGLHLDPAPSGTGVTERCTRVRAEPGQPAVVSLPPGGAELRPRSGTVAVFLRRYYDGTGFPIDLGSGGERFVLAIPTDGSSRPWEAQLWNSHVVRVCPL